MADDQESHDARVEAIRREVLEQAASAASGDHSAGDAPPVGRLIPAKPLAQHQDTKRIGIRCEGCKAQGFVPMHFAGRPVKCKACGRVLIACDGVPLDSMELLPEPSALAAAWAKTKDAAATNWRRFRRWQIDRAERRAEFLQNHFACPSCRAWVGYDDTNCATCGRPFQDPVAISMWRQREALEAMSRELAATRKDAASARQRTRGNAQGCGCLLVVLALVLFFTPLMPCGALIGVIGLAVLAVGFVV